MMDDENQKSRKRETTKFPKVVREPMVDHGGQRRAIQKFDSSKITIKNSRKSHLQKSFQIVSESIDYHVLDQ